MLGLPDSSFSWACFVPPFAACQGSGMADGGLRMRIGDRGLDIDSGGPPNAPTNIHTTELQFSPGPCACSYFLWPSRPSVTPELPPRPLWSPSTDSVHARNMLRYLYYSVHGTVADERTSCSLANQHLFASGSAKGWRTVHCVKDET